MHLFDGSHVFVHAPLYHWHATTAKGEMVVDQEVREHVVSITSLLDRFDHYTKQREEELWAWPKGATKGSQMVRLVEPLNECIMRLEQQLASLQLMTKIERRVNNEQVYVERTPTILSKPWQALHATWLLLRKSQKLFWTVCRVNWRIWMKTWQQLVSHNWRSSNY